jgi:purine nucleosidase
MNSRNGLIHDHDGAVDDLIALSLLASHANLVLTTLSPADCRLEPSLLATQRLLQLLNSVHVDLAHSHDEGLNRFPSEWRDASHALPRLPILETFANDNRNSRLASPNMPSLLAPERLVQLLSQPPKLSSEIESMNIREETLSFDFVATGPLTNLALALDLQPSIAANIARVWLMGGAVHVKGNVEAALVEVREESDSNSRTKHDGSAEWNIFCHPVAAKRVFDAKIPITLVSLDITNHFPLSRAFLDELKLQSASYALSRFACEAWSLVLPLMNENDTVQEMAGESFDLGQYYLWDTLTALCYLNPSLFSFKTERVRVITAGASEGRTFCVPDDEVTDDFVAVEIPQLHATPRKVEQYLLQLLRK